MATEIATGTSAAAGEPYPARAMRLSETSTVPLSSRQEGDALVVKARLTGNFPGSPVELNHRFLLADGRIKALEITV